MRVLLVDHHDSFTWNLAHAVAACTGRLPAVIAHDDARLASLDWGQLDAVVLSPGPGRPDRCADARFTAEALAEGRPPVLGVCLGMQVMAHHAGGRVVHAPSPRHGRTSPVVHDGQGLFEGIPSPTELVRYHSLACVDLPAACPGGPSGELVGTAWTDDADRVLMALRHTSRPWWGVQFHPESIASGWGQRLIANFVAIAGARRGPRIPPRPPAAAPMPLSPLPPSPLPSSPVRAPTPLLHAALPGAVDAEWLHGQRFSVPPSVWFDGAATSVGTRWSILGDASGPLAYTVSYRAPDQSLTIQRAGVPPEVRKERLLDFLRDALRAPRPPVAGLPFALGFCGVFGYELRADLGAPVPHPARGADAELLFLDRAVIVDHLEGVTHLLALDHVDNRAWMASITTLLAAAPAPRPPVAAVPPDPGPPLALAWRHDRAAYLARVHAAGAHLHEGESYELCLTNEVRFPYDVPPGVAYRVLRRVNPAPFAALLDLGEVAVLSSSPERFVSVTAAGVVTAQPIKGTRRREGDATADAAARDGLRASEKDRAENLMIVDLLRNDLGRVCEPGSVAVPNLYAVESFATVHQLVSTITGRLRAGLGATDVLEAAFPPGSMTGAPKARSMTLLDALEGGPRGVYSGAVGYLSLCGAADLSVLIRAAVLSGGEASVGVGGAVVTLSDPEAEVDEMELKAAAVLDALARARHPALRPPTPRDTRPR
ncbi:MAG: chorismate-binding protein [Pseudomonadota bacterium]|nr:chorismate-binding protein [Pseudomonadota bacterium]